MPWPSGRRDSFRERCMSTRVAPLGERPRPRQSGKGPDLADFGCLGCRFYSKMSKSCGAWTAGRRGLSGCGLNRALAEAARKLLRATANYRGFGAVVVGGHTALRAGMSPRGGGCIDGVVGSCGFVAAGGFVSQNSIFGASEADSVGASFCNIGISGGGSWCSLRGSQKLVSGIDGMGSMASGQMLVDRLVAPPRILVRVLRARWRLRSWVVR